jgi:hypothetical protein
VKKIKCINNNGYEANIKLGQIFTIGIDCLETSSSKYYYFDELGPIFKTRFVEVSSLNIEEHELNHQTFEKFPQSKRMWNFPGNHNPTKQQLDDLEEARLRKLLMPRIEKDECPCGIKRVQCDYHR